MKSKNNLEKSKMQHRRYHQRADLLADTFDLSQSVL